MRPHVPHDGLSPGYWYLRTDYSPGYTIVSLTKFVIGPNTGELGVWMFDQEGNSDLADFSADQFIGPVFPPS